MIGIIDYGVGNLKAFAHVYKRLNIDYKIVSNHEELDNITKIILPGVGSFDHAMLKLNHSGLKEKLEECVLVQNIPVLGVCIGMQMLADSSDEGTMPGLGWIKGTVKKMKCSGAPLPHMGWNQLMFSKKHPLFDDLDQTARFYFLHSYYFESDDPEHNLAFSHYYNNFTSMVNRGNIYGIQCHPEKSHYNGVTLLKNFAGL